MFATHPLYLTPNATDTAVFLHRGYWRRAKNSRPNHPIGAVITRGSATEFIGDHGRQVNTPAWPRPLKLITAILGTVWAVAFIFQLTTPGNFPFLLIGIPLVLFVAAKELLPAPLPEEHDAAALAEALSALMECPVEIAQRLTTQQHSALVDAWDSGVADEALAVISEQYEAWLAALRKNSLAQEEIRRQARRQLAEDILSGTASESDPSSTSRTS